MGNEEKEWASLLAEIFERLTSKHASITYEFDNMTLEGTKSNTSDITIPNGKISINGKLTISSS
ncbi:MAG: hypothetical protein OXF28_01415 [Thaumarchaeota archaeon]|nr:hypothetical protein [Nitrososphaerota archaeon]MCY3975778.1 hypothetical protein [Nitrososphaerota archaeon]